MKTYYILILFFTLIGKSYAFQDNSTSKTITHRLVSDEGIEYLIKVTTPPGYSEDKKYSTLYYLDAWWLEDLVKGTYNILNYSKNIETVILVGITITGNELNFNEQRTRDYTPAPYDIDIMKFPFSIPLKSGLFKVTNENSGKSVLFRKFLKNKVFKKIIESYSINQSKRAFLGHSFGGLFGIYELIKEDILFTDYIIIAPALWWNKSNGLYESLKSINKIKDWSPNLYICYGDANDLFIVKSTNKFISYLNSNNINRLKYKFIKYSDDDHVSVLPKAIYDGLMYVYQKQR